MTAPPEPTGPAEPSPCDVIDEAIAKTAATVDANGAFCSGWVLVATWVGANGDFWLTRLTDDRASRWQTIGLLRTAQLHYEHEMVFGEETD